MVLGQLLLKTLTAVYLRMRGVKIPDEEGILSVEEEPKERNWKILI